MAVAAYGASIQVGANTLHGIDSFELPFEMDMLETTSFSQAAPGTKTSIPGLLGMETSFSGNWDLSDPAQQALEDAHFGRTIVALVCTINTKTYSFDAWVSKYNIKAEVDGKAEVEFSITMNGDVTRG